MKTIYTLFLLIATNSLFAQNTIRFAQVNFAQGVNNPASLAYDGKLMADIIVRNQWFGFEGAPTTIALNAQYEIDADMAVGLNVFHDRIGREHDLSHPVVVSNISAGRPEIFLEVS